LSEEDKELLREYIKSLRNYHEPHEIEEALQMLEHAEYNPSYKSAFSGKKFEGEDKEFFQVQDKIDAFFKYGDEF